MTTRRGRTTERAPADPAAAPDPAPDRTGAAAPPEPAQESAAGLVPAVVVGHHRWTKVGRVARRDPRSGRDVLTRATVGEAGDGEAIEVSPRERERGLALGTLMRPEEYRRREQARQEADELRRRLAVIEREHGQL